METSVYRNSSRAAFGTPHCPVCVMFLGQPVPVVSTPQGYGLFCEVCALGRNAPTVRVADAKRLQMRVDDAPPDDRTGSAEEE